MSQMSGRTSLPAELCRTGRGGGTCGALHGSRAANLNGKPHIFHGNTGEAGAHRGCRWWTVLCVPPNCFKCVREGYGSFHSPITAVRCVYKSQRGVIQQNLPAAQAFQRRRLTEASACLNSAAALTLSCGAMSGAAGWGCGAGCEITGHTPRRVLGKISRPFASLWEPLMFGAVCMSLHI